MSGHVHFLGICGYAVSGAALVAREQGWRVSGSDDQAYPPTTDILTAAGVDWVDGSDAANLERWGVPDLVVVGNQTRATNPEWLAARDRGLPVCSEIEFYLRLTADRHRIAVCGTVKVGQALGHGVFGKGGQVDQTLVHLRLGLLGFHLPVVGVVEAVHRHGAVGVHRGLKAWPDV